MNVSTRLARDRWLVTLVSLTSLLIGACFEPEPTRCLPCKRSCPTGEACIDGLCQTQAGECKLGANSSVCDEQCCLEGACFDLKRHIPPDSLALWLDWTSLYEGQSSPIWRDRSSNGHTFSNEGPSPKFSSSQLPDAHVLRFSAVGQYLALEGPERFTLNNSDFLLVVAGSLSCDAPDAAARQCLVARLADKTGLRLCATLDANQASLISTCAQGDAPPTCVTAVVSGVPCERMQLFTLRRSSSSAADGGRPSSLVELRHNAVAQAQVELDPGLSLEVFSPLRIGGRAMQSFVGEVALVALFIGTVGARETCELERFLLSRMASAAELPDCSLL